MLGRPILVDELSLIKLGPVRMKLACKSPAKLNGTVEVWFNHEGYQIKVELERMPRRLGDGGGASGAGPSAPPPDSQQGKGDPSKQGPSAGKAPKAAAIGAPIPGTGASQKEAAGSGAKVGGQDVVMGEMADDPEDSIQDTSIDTETWEKLGVIATQDTAVSLPPLARSLDPSFEVLGSSLTAPCAPLPLVARGYGAMPGSSPRGGGRARGWNASSWTRTQLRPLTGACRVALADRPRRLRGGRRGARRWSRRLRGRFRRWEAIWARLWWRQGRQSRPSVLGQLRCRLGLLALAPRPSSET